MLFPGGTAFAVGPDSAMSAERNGTAQGRVPVSFSLTDVTESLGSCYRCLRDVTRARCPALQLRQRDLSRWDVVTVAGDVTWAQGPSSQLWRRHANRWFVMTAARQDLGSGAQRHCCSNGHGQVARVTVAGLGPG